MGTGKDFGDGYVSRVSFLWGGGRPVQSCVQIKVGEMKPKQENGERMKQRGWKETDEDVETGHNLIFFARAYSK
jgi:hypothetical protein